MKTSLYTILIATFLQGVCLAQQVNAKQATIVVERTTDLSPTCGGYAWTFFKDLKVNVAGKPAILLAAHFSGNLFREFAKELSDNYGGGFEPIFYVNGVNNFLRANNIPSTVAATSSIINKNAESTSFLAVGALIIKKDDNSYTVRASWEAQAAISNADYYLSAYVVRDNFIAPQSGQGNSASHTNVVDINLMSSTFGQSIMKGSIANGVKNTVDIPMNAITLHPNATLADVKVVVLVWNKVGEKFEFVNGVETDLSKFVTSSASFASGSNDFKVYQVANELIVEFDKDTKNSTSVSLYNIVGQRVASAPIGIGNMKSISLAGTQPGVYMVNVFNDGKSSTRKVLIK